jgi:hypothetical protein
MEKVLGPIDGYYAAIFVRGLGGKFRASYKICSVAPADYRSAYPLRHKRADALLDSAAQAMEIAEQLVRLHIARLRDERHGHTQDSLPPPIPLDFDSSLGEGLAAQDTGRMYAATEPSPLYAAAESPALHARRRD